MRRVIGQWRLANVFFLFLLASDFSAFRAVLRHKPAFLFFFVGFPDLSLSLLDHIVFFAILRLFSPLFDVFATNQPEHARHFGIMESSSMLCPKVLTVQFTQLLNERRLNTFHSQRQLKQHAHDSSNSNNSNNAVGRPPSASLLSAMRSYPIFPQPPSDPLSVKLCNMLRALSFTPMQYENPGLLDEALGVIPLDRIYSDAEERQLLMTQAQSQNAGGQNATPPWGYQDLVIQALLKYLPPSFPLIP